MKAKKKKSLRRFLPTYRSFAYFTFAVGLGAILYGAGAAKLFHFLVALPSAFDSEFGNWFPDRFERSGVLSYDPARAQPGYTLYTVASDLTTHLVDMKGREVHKWLVPLDVAVPGSNRSIKTFFGLAVQQSEGGYLYPNGDILLIFEVRMLGHPVMPLVKLDKDSNVIWRTQIGVHHAIKVAGDKIYALTMEGEGTRPRDTRRQEPVRAAPSSADSVTVFDADGKTLSTHSVMDAIANTQDMRLLDEVRSYRGPLEILHTNSIDVLTEQTARFIPGAKPGDVLLLLRTLDMLVVMDLEAEKIVWALRGSWRKPHDAQMLPNGHILLFDNRGDLITKHGPSRVVEIDPRTGGIVWSYDGTDADPLDSADNRGGVQRLPNGNTLIDEANAGRILEVTPDQKVVWEFVGRNQTVVRGRRYIASLGLRAHRYDPSYLKFLSADKSPVATH